MMAAMMGRWFGAVLVMLFCAIPVVHAEEAGSQQGNGVTVMEEFSKKQASADRAQEDKEKHQIMFLLGIPLLLFILITAVLGIAMVVYGKQVFMAHMIFAGLSITLAIVHVITGFVWFYPF